MHCVALLMGFALLLSACAGEATTSTSSASTTSVPGTTGVTTTSIARSGPPSYLVYGWDGVTRVEGAEARRLAIDPVRQAWDDGAGGVVYWTVTEEPGVLWLPAGADRPVKIDVGGGDILVGLVDGKPSIVVGRSSDLGPEWCDPPDVVVEEITIRDLQTGQERFVACLYQSSDSSVGISSYGGGMFTVERDIWLIGHTSGPLRFVDLSGREVVVKHNPFAESCAPCELDVKLSPDGSLLAFAYWPTSSIVREEPPDGDYTRVFDEWWEASRDIPTQLVVLDLETGD